MRGERHFQKAEYTPENAEPFNFKELLGFTSFFNEAGAVRNTDHKFKAKTNLVSACGKPNLGEYAAKPHLPGLAVKIPSKNGESNNSDDSSRTYAIFQ